MKKRIILSIFSWLLILMVSITMTTMHVNVCKALDDSGEEVITDEDYYDDDYEIYDEEDYEEDYDEDLYEYEDLEDVYDMYEDADIYDYGLKDDGNGGHLGVGTIVVTPDALYKVLSIKNRKLAFIDAPNQKEVVVPSTLKIKGKKYKVTKICANAITWYGVRKVTIGKNVRVIKPKAFNGSNATKIVLKTKYLKKSTVKNCLKGSRIKTLIIKVGNKKTNRQYVKKYKRIFTKKITGRKVKVKVATK